MKKTFLALVAVLALTVSGCNQTQLAGAKTAVDTAGAVCQILVAASDPTLAPLCTTAVQIGDAVTALVGAHVPVTGAATDGPYKPTNDEVYAYLASHGAKALARH